MRTASDVAALVPYFFTPDRRLRCVTVHAGLFRGLPALRPYSPYVNAIPYRENARTEPYSQRTKEKSARPYESELCRPTHSRTLYTAPYLKKPLLARPPYRSCSCSSSVRRMCGCVHASPYAHVPSYQYSSHG